MPDTRIGLIGLGSFNSNYHQRRLLEREDAAVTAICDISDSNLQRTAERFPDSTTFTDYRELLDSDLVDGIIVSTPNQYHFEQCKAAIERDIPVLVDKPITVTVSDAEQLVALSKSRGVILQTAFTRHFMASTEHVRQEMRSGQLDVQRMTAIQRGSEIKNTIQDGGMLHRRTVHIFDVVPWITGRRVERVSATVEYESGQTEEQMVSAKLELEGGLSCNLLCITDCEERHDEVNVYGKTHSYRLDKQTIERGSGRSGWEKLDLPGIGNSTAHFVEAIRGGTFDENGPFADPHSEDGLQAMRVLWAVHEAGQTGKVVEVGSRS